MNCDSFALFWRDVDQRVVADVRGRRRVEGGEEDRRRSGEDRLGLIDRINDVAASSVVRLDTCGDVGRGELGSGSGGPPGVNEAPVICGAVLSMRNASSSDDDRPGQRRLSRPDRPPRPARAGSLRASAAGAGEREGTVGVGRHRAGRNVPVKPRSARADRRA